jgi:hypothetical protein
MSLHTMNGQARNGRVKPIKPSANGEFRDAKSGQFTKGNPGGPGNPTFRKLAAARRIILETVSDDDLRAVVHVLLERAKNGEIEAAKLLLAYRCGRPAGVVNPDREDLDEWTQADDQPSVNRLWARMLETISPQQALQLLRDALATRDGKGIKDLKPVDNQRVIDEMKCRVGK